MKKLQETRTCRDRICDSCGRKISKGEKYIRAKDYSIYVKQYCFKCTVIESEGE